MEQNLSKNEKPMEKPYPSGTPNHNGENQQAMSKCSSKKAADENHQPQEQSFIEILLPIMTFS